MLRQVRIVFEHILKTILSFSVLFEIFLNIEV